MTWPVHHPVTEELEPGRGVALRCEADDEPWPCTHEQQLAVEPPTDYPGGDPAVCGCGNPEAHRG